MSDRYTDSQNDLEAEINYLVMEGELPVEYVDIYRRHRTGLPVTKQDIKEAEAAIENKIKESESGDWFMLPKE